MDVLCAKPKCSYSPSVCVNKSPLPGSSAPHTSAGKSTHVQIPLPRPMLPIVGHQQVQAPMVNYIRPTHAVPVIPRVSDGKRFSITSSKPMFRRCRHNSSALAWLVESRSVSLSPLKSLQATLCVLPRCADISRYYAHILKDRELMIFRAKMPCAIVTDSLTALGGVMVTNFW